MSEPIADDYNRIVWQAAAKNLGWRWSSAHDGYISENHRQRPNEDPDGWGSYEVAPDAEHACFRDGIETISQAENMLPSPPLSTPSQ